MGQPKTNATNNRGVRYQAHCQAYGWLPWVHDGQTAGTVGEAKRMECLRVDMPTGIKLDAQYYSYGYGWDYLVGLNDGDNIGTTGMARALNAIALIPHGLKDSEILQYRCHIADMGWTDWVVAPFACGTTFNKRIEAIQIRII